MNGTFLVKSQNVLNLINLSGDFTKLNYEFLCLNLRNFAENVTQQFMQYA